MRTIRLAVAALLLALVGLGAPAVALAAQPEGPAYLRLAYVISMRPAGAAAYHGRQARELARQPAVGRQGFA